MAVEQGGCCCNHDDQHHTRHEPGNGHQTRDATSATESADCCGATDMDVHMSASNSHAQHATAVASSS